MNYIKATYIRNNTLIISPNCAKYKCMYDVHTCLCTCVYNFCIKSFIIDMAFNKTKVKCKPLGFFF